MQGQPTLDVTVVVPLLDEEESLRELKAGIDRVLAVCVLKSFSLTTGAKMVRGR